MVSKGGIEMDKFCVGCGTKINAQEKFCGGCGQSITESAAPAVNSLDALETAAAHETTAPLVNRKSGLIAGGLVVLAAVTGFGLYAYTGAGKTGVSSQSLGTTEGTTPDDEANALVKYLIADANIRAHANAKDAAIVTKLKRGTMVIGSAKQGDDPTSQWLKLSDGRGFISLVNLSDIEPPKLATTLNDQSWFPTSDLTIKQAPDASSPAKTAAKAGNTYYLAGITENGFVEVKLGKGGVGYVSTADAGLSQEMQSSQTESDEGSQASYDQAAESGPQEAVQMADGDESNAKIVSTGSSTNPAFYDKNPIIQKIEYNCLKHGNGSQLLRKDVYYTSGSGYSKWTNTPCKFR
jgi:hypothetical protein